MDKEWDMTFVQSPESALTLLSQKRFDVIISDMNMPRMDGAQLMRNVKKKHPQTYRIILSGDLDKQFMAEAHQCLSKPCPKKTLIEAIRQSEAF